jgi:hypothetical protein
VLHLIINASNTTNVAQEITLLRERTRAKGIPAEEIELLCTQVEISLSDLARSASQVMSKGSTFQASRVVKTPNCTVQIAFGSAMRLTIIERIRAWLGAR